MSHSIKEQISNKCKHFNGVMSKTCKAGVDYATVKVGSLITLPCLNTGGECTKREFLTPEEIEERLKEIARLTKNVIGPLIRAKQHYHDTKENPGKIKCSCGGDLHYAVAESNGHFRGACKTCGISFME